MELLENGQRYRAVSSEWKKRFGAKVKKIMLISGCTCPNRDGSLGERGCIFCSEGGSGEFAGTREQDLKAACYKKDGQGSFFDGKLTATDILEQIRAQQGFREKNGMELTQPMVAYFQSFTNTYAPIEYVKPLFEAAIFHPQVCALSIATRPDCLSEEMVEYLGTLRAVKPVMVELGLQTIHKDTAEWMRRGYELPVFDDAVRRLRRFGIEVIVHTILGLPNEGKEEVAATMRYLNDCDIQGVKLQLLHVIAGTDLAEMYKRGELSVLSREEYVALAAMSIGILRRDLILHRVTGDGDARTLLAPLWSKDKLATINALRHYMKEQNIIQGMFSQEGI